LAFASLSLFCCPRAHRALHSFPTRRSSDLYPGLSERIFVAARSGRVTRFRLRFSVHELDLPLGESIVGRSSSVWITIDDPLISRSEEHTSELQSRENLVCRLLLEKKKKHTN